VTGLTQTEKRSGDSPPIAQDKECQLCQHDKNLEADEREESPVSPPSYQHGIVWLKITGNQVEEE
jgi:hypothetical protein